MPQRLTLKPLNGPWPCRCDALDNVLDVTFWPLPQQRDEAMAKRRIGVGFTGMGNTLAMLQLRYNAPEGRAMAARIAERMRDAAYEGIGGAGPEKARSQVQTQMATWPRHLCQPLAPALCKKPSASMAFATATCCPSRPPAR